MAPRAKSIEELKASGTYRPGRHGESAPDFASPTRPPDPPKRLNRWGSQEWRRVARELHAVGLLKKIDYGALGVLCEEYGRMMEIDNGIKKEFGSWDAYLKETNYQTNIRGTHYYQAHDKYKKLLAEFLLTPRARAAIRLGDVGTGEGEGLGAFEPA